MGPDLSPGAVFAGFRIARSLGTGGMGAVYAARHPRLPRDVALKLLRADPGDAGAAARFDREAEIIARLDHPSIVSVLDRGVDQGISWISIQLVDGRDAASELREGGPLPVTDAVTYIRQVAVALEAAHRSDVVHRDVKPANIMIAHERPGQPRRALLTDFGISGLTSPEGRLKITGRLDVPRATIAYASPEQLRGEQVDGRSDQYSLACTLYALLVGAAPYLGTTAMDIGRGHLNAPVPNVRAARPEVPEQVATAIERAMAKRPEDRFTSCADFAEGLDVQPARRRRTSVLVVAGLLAVALALGAGWYALTDRDDSAPVEAGATTVTPTSTSTVDEERALWRKAQPGIALWPDLLPSGPKVKGHENMVCIPRDEPTAATKVPFVYVLRCTAREDGYDQPTITLDLLSYAPGKAEEALAALDPPPWVPRFPSSSLVRMYHFSEPEDGDWILLTFPGERSDFHMQVGSEDGEMSYQELFDWVVDAPL